MGVDEGKGSTSTESVAVTAFDENSTTLSTVKTAILPSVRNEGTLLTFKSSGAAANGLVLAVQGGVFWSPSGGRAADEAFPGSRNGAGRRWRSCRYVSVARLTRSQDTISGKSWCGSDLVKYLSCSVSTSSSDDVQQ